MIKQIRESEFSGIHIAAKFASDTEETVFEKEYENFREPFRLIKKILTSFEIAKMRDRFYAEYIEIRDYDPFTGEINDYLLITPDILENGLPEEYQF